MATETKIRWSKETLEFLIRMITETYQEKESGKGLSKNDFTDILLAKLNGIEENAEKNTIKKIKLGGTAATPDANRELNIPVMVGANTNTDGQIGLVPMATAAERAKYLRADGSWGVPDNTTYEEASTTKDGLMSSADKAKLDGIEAEAKKVVVDASLSSSSSNAIQNKAVNEALSAKAPLASPEFTGTPLVPTANAGTNTTQAASTAFVKTAVDNAIAGLKGIQQVFVADKASLPATGDSSKIYFVPNGSSGDDKYDEYVYLDGKGYERKGSANVDLSGYMKEADYPMVTEAEITAMFAT